MAIYQVYFDTQKGEKSFPSDIDDAEKLEDAVKDMVAELSQEGYFVKGLSTGDLKVICNGRELDLSQALPKQEVKVEAGDKLRILIDSYEAGSLSIRSGRIEQEWRLLESLRDLNPESLTLLDRTTLPVEDVFYLRLLGCPGLEAISEQKPVERNSHTLRLCFPRLYPDVPIECFVKESLIHPNVRMETGFVCLWQQFDVGDNVIQAVCRAQAIAAYRLVNLSVQHVMNPMAAEWYSQIAEPQALVPLTWNELNTFYVEDGRLQWLEPQRRQRNRKLGII